MQNDSRTYSYYFELFGAGICKLYEFEEKELCLRDYITYMLIRTQKIFKYEGLPDTIPQRLFEMLIQINGFACVTKVRGKLYAFWGGLGGEPDEYYQPTLCVVSNPYLKLSETYEVGKDCVIVRNDSYYCGLLPLFRRYGTAMVENDLSFKMASINSRIQALITAPDDVSKEAGDKYLEDIAAGKLGVLASNEFLEGIKAQPVQGSMRTFTDLIEYQQYLKASWYNEIGLNANYNMKREKLSTTESQMNNDALLPLVDDMLEQRRQGVEEINKMFGTSISVDFDSSWAKLLEEFEQSSQMDSEGGELNETGTDGGDTPREDAGSVSDSGSERTDGSGKEVGGEDSSGGVHSEENGENGESDKVDAEESGDSGDVETGFELENPDVSVEVRVEVNTDGNENDADGSMAEDTDESGDNSADG